MPDIKECPACGVKIEDGTKVLFSYGAPGTLSRLHARVCQYSKRPGCINKPAEDLEISDSDYYD